jgi:hypothetical protein
MKKKVASTKKAIGTAARTVAAKALAATGITLNALMVWLNSTFGLNLPTLDAPGFPSVLVSLWNLNVPTGIPSGGPPYQISIQGSWPALFPPSGNPALQLDNIVVNVTEKPASPN